MKRMMYEVSQDKKSKMWYCHMKGYSYIPCFGSFCEKKSESMDYAKMYNGFSHRVTEIERKRYERGVKRMVSIKQALQDLNKSELIEFDENGDVSAKYSICTTSGELMILLEELQRYRELEEQGLLLRLHCKVGDMLYEPTSRKSISTYKIKEIRIELFGIFAEWEIVDGFVYRNINGVDTDEIGKTVFLTKSEAEQALAKMKKAVK
jgi:hypothetical protein